MLKLTQMSDSELLAVVNDSENVNSFSASGQGTLVRDFKTRASTEKGSPAVKRTG